MTNRRRILLVLSILLLCVSCDQATKAVAKLHLPKTRCLSYAGDTIRLDYTVNKGAVMTFECCLPKEWQGPIFTAGVSSLVGVLLISLLFAPVSSPLSAISLSMVCGGILGNLLDRVFFGGDVVDFISLGWGAARTGIFNMADLFISIGVVLWVLRLMGAVRSFAFRRYRSNRKVLSSRLDETS